MRPMSKLILFLGFALLFPCSADHAEATQFTDGVPRRGERDIADGLQRPAGLANRLGADAAPGAVVPTTGSASRPAEMPAPSTFVLPFGIAPEDAYTDPKVACEAEAKKLVQWSHRRGVSDYCKFRSWASWRGQRPRPWVDGSLIHVRDLAHSHAAWKLAKRAGYFVDSCEYQAEKAHRGHFTRGWFDVSYALLGHYLTTERPLPCWDAAIFDRIDVGARVVVARAAILCARHPKFRCTKHNLQGWWKDKRWHG